jgi:hypothetical protein
MRAAFTNLSQGRVAQGGSTLTQQLAKNLFLGSERTWSRKLEELVLALWLAWVGFVSDHSLYRIWRDTRFSDDKRPLKTNVAAQVTLLMLGVAMQFGCATKASPPLPTWTSRPRSAETCCTLMALPIATSTSALAEKCSRSR